MGDLPELAPDEDLSYLLGDWRIFQLRKGHRWSVDDLVTAWYAWWHRRHDPPGFHLDLGCGIGSVLHMMAWHFEGCRHMGVEVQTRSVELARRTSRWNGCDHRVEVRFGDLRTLQPADLPGAPSFITGTPPYFPPGTAKPSDRSQNRRCRVEEFGGIEDYCEVAARLLSAEGSFFVCEAAMYQGRAEEAAHAAGLDVVARLDVVPKVGKALLFQVFHLRHIRGGWSTPRVDTLVVRDLESRFTPQYLALKRDMGLPFTGVASPAVLS
jgi:tRNA1(Val) A37 N6-methylase TrmN6